MSRARALEFYVGAIGLVTAALVAAALYFAARMGPAAIHTWALKTVLLIALCWLVTRQQVYFSDSNTVVMGTIGHMVAIILLPLPLAILVVAVAKSLCEVSRRLQRKTRSWRAPVVNTGASVLASAAGGAAYHMLHGPQYLWDSGIRVVLAFPALTGLAALHHVIDVVVVVGAISLSSKDPPWAVFRSVLRHMLLPEASLIFVGIVFAVLLHFSPVLSLLIVAPVVFSARSFEAVARMRKETVDAVLKMADIIDYRDTGTYEHSNRLADYSRRLATALGLIPERITEIVLASRVHDLGKIGISNAILLKPGPLTPDDRRVMEEHPVIGADILSRWSAFEGSVDIVKHHHERWDGKGYPDCLKGEEIPVGSRIISIVDAFDAMTADRPYRKGMGVDVAVERLQAGMGTQFDARICGTFIQLLIEEGTYVPGEPVPSLRLVSPEVSATEATAS